MRCSWRIVRQVKSHDVMIVMSTTSTMKMIGRAHNDGRDLLVVFVLIGGVLIEFARFYFTRYLLMAPSSVFFFLLLLLLFWGRRNPPHLQRRLATRERPAVRDPFPFFIRLNWVLIGLLFQSFCFFVCFPPPPPNPFSFPLFFILLYGTR